MIQLYPIEIEAYQDGGLYFKVTAVDEFRAEIEMPTYQSAESWPETSAAIMEALKMMKLGDDRK